MSPIDVLVIQSMALLALASGLLRCRVSSQLSRSGPPGSRMEMMLSLLYDIPVKVLSNTARALVTMEASPDAILKRNKW
jgi:hypothetical protein